MNSGTRLGRPEAMCSTPQICFNERRSAEYSVSDKLRQLQGDLTATALAWLQRGEPAASMRECAQSQRVSIARARERCLTVSCPWV